jgi:hypothetical protein
MFWSIFSCQSNIQERLTFTLLGGKIQGKSLSATTAVTARTVVTHLWTGIVLALINVCTYTKYENKLHKTFK